MNEIVNIMIRGEGKDYGPYTLKQVKSYLSNGTLLAHDVAQVQGDADWIPLQDLVAKLSAASSEPAAAAPTAPVDLKPAELNPILVIGLAVIGVLFLGLIALVAFFPTMFGGMMKH